MTSKQKYGIAIVVVALLLIAFLYYYFFKRKTGETCPDGRTIPASGDCADNSALKDSSGNLVVTTAPIANKNGCLTPSKYTTNYFPLALGMQGDLVKQVQHTLNVKYNYNLSEDGFFGCNTLDALQQSLGLSTIDAQLFKEQIYLGSVPIAV